MLRLCSMLALHDSRRLVLVVAPVTGAVPDPFRKVPYELEVHVT